MTHKRRNGDDSTCELIATSVELALNVAVSVCASIFYLATTVTGGKRGCDRNSRLMEAGW